MSSTKQKIISAIFKLKSQSGTHSPSIATMLREIPELNIKVDACFLSNPYATDLFLNYLQNDLIVTNRLRDVLEFYPPQNGDIAQIIGKSINVNHRQIFAGNGAIECIQAVMHNFAGKKISVPLPTFSSYYEYAINRAEICYYYLNKQDDYKINVADYISFIKKNNIETAVLINPNNPNGAYLTQTELRGFVENLTDLKLVIIDESFVHFAYEDEHFTPVSIAQWVKEFPNLVVIKSMSKDFGIAGIRAGYAVMNENRVSQLLQNGYLWNVSGLADYFFKLYATEEFQKKYDEVRKKYIVHTQSFLADLNSITGIKIYPSKANFALMEIINGKSSFDFSMEMLCNHNVYVRDCSDKIGLEGSFIRIASRSETENKIIAEAIKESITA